MSKNYEPYNVEELTKDPRKLAVALDEAVKAFNASDNGRHEWARMMFLVGLAITRLNRLDDDH